jgi:hypothetical protein
MSNLVATLKRLIRELLGRRRAAAQPRRAGFAAGSREDEVANASPERAGELAGHAVERVET